MTGHSGCKTLELVTFNVHAVMVPSDTREGRWDSKVTVAGSGGWGGRSEKHGKLSVTWADSKAIILGTMPFLD